ncbi:MAG: hypothetical protein HQ503_16860 [Rhodospirillales bacterium]|nr:hypothetical protein [Rhodospirillales bacterium]
MICRHWLGVGRLTFAIILPIVLISLISNGAGGQSINFASGDRNKPIEVFADNGIEWQQDNEVLIARGNARAVRSQISITAEVLRAFYRKINGQRGTDLSRLDAAGNVRIKSPAESIVGATAVYDLEKAVLVVSGKKVIYTSGKNIITADRQMEYYETAGEAIARGNAKAFHDGKTIGADVLQAKFRKTAKGKSEIFEVHAFDNVFILTDQDTVRADKGIYNVPSGMATLVGNVRITRGGSQLAGDKAEINVNTGISKLLTDNGPSSGSGGPQSEKPKKRVRGLILPQRR